MYKRIVQLASPALVQKPAFNADLLFVERDPLP